MELQGQLEIMKVQQAEFGHCGQGNSLFGEVGLEFITNSMKLNVLCFTC